MSSLCFGFSSTKRKQWLLYSCLYLLSLLVFQSAHGRLGLLWSFRDFFSGALLICTPCVTRLPRAISWMGRDIGKQSFCSHFVRFCFFLYKQNTVAYDINLASIGMAYCFREPSPHLTKHIKKKQIDEKQSENSLSLCCLGTRPSGAGAAVQKHHSNGSDKLHPQLPQGKHTIANDYCKHFLKVTVRFDLR